jgi:hypothetical protein
MASAVSREVKQGMPSVRARRRIRTLSREDRKSVV